MGTETERKFTVKNSGYRKGAKKIFIQQGFLNTNKNRVVRVRIVDQIGYLTIKGITNGINRLEFEYEIPVEEARIMLKTLCKKPIISKWRYILKQENLTWEIDEFLDENQGLIIAEIELPDDNYPVSLPSWIDKEVSHDQRYYNSNLVQSTYQSWE